MKVALLGATRGTGKHVLEQALERGHEVRALVRSALPLQHPKLTVVQGDALQSSDVARVVQGADAVVSSLGASKLWSTSRVVSRGAAATAQAMTEAAVKRLVFVSVRGAGEPGLLFSAVSLVPRLLAWGIWDNVVADKNRAERIFRAAGLYYTFVRAPSLTDGPKTGRYRAFVEAAVRPGGVISRADLAAFILDELEKNEFVCAAPVVVGA